MLEPKKGLYDKFVIMLDFNSLYPSIIQVWPQCSVFCLHLRCWGVLVGLWHECTCVFCRHVCATPVCRCVLLQFMGSPAKYDPNRTVVLLYCLQEYNICFTTVQRPKDGSLPPLPESGSGAAGLAPLPSILQGLVQRRRQVSVVGLLRECVLACVLL